MPNIGNIPFFIGNIPTKVLLLNRNFIRILVSNRGKNIWFSNKKEIINDNEIRAVSF